MKRGVHVSGTIWGRDHSAAPGGGFVCRLTLFPGAVDLLALVYLALAMLFIFEATHHPWQPSHAYSCTTL